MTGRLRVPDQTLQPLLDLSNAEDIVDQAYRLAARPLARVLAGCTRSDAVLRDVIAAVQAAPTNPWIIGGRS